MSQKFLIREQSCPKFGNKNAKVLNQQKMTMKQCLTTAARLVCLTAASAVLAQCAKEMITKEDLDLDDVYYEQRNIEAGASLPQNSDKAYLDLITVKWNSGDAIDINGTQITESGISSDGRQATFYCSPNAMRLENNTKDAYWATYPTSIATTTRNENTVSVTLPATQIYDNSTDTMKGYTYMVGFAKVQSGAPRVPFSMRNIGAVLKISLKNGSHSKSTRVTKLVITSTNNKPLCGNFSITNDDDPTVSAAGNNTSYTLTVNLKSSAGNYIDVSGADSVIIPVILPPMAGGNLTLKVYNNDEYYVEKTKTNCTLERNTVYKSTVSSVTFNKYHIYYSVSPSGYKVLFAKGNLEYKPSTGTWQFCPTQYGYRGTNNNNAGSSSYTDWLDLFGYGTSGQDNYYPYLASANNPDYPNQDIVNTNCDWGKKNASSLGVDAWHLLTKDQWHYLFHTRKVKVSGEEKYPYGFAKVNGAVGVIILPDKWDGLTDASFNYGNCSNYTLKDYTSQSTPTWSAMEAAGCVFLVKAGRRWGKSTEAYGSEGFCWTGTNGSSAGNAYALIFQTNSVYTGEQPRAYGFSVRLVKDYSNN